MLAKLKSLFTKEQTQDDTEIEIDIAAASLMLEVSWSDHHVGDAELEAFNAFWWSCIASTRQKLPR